MFEAAAGASPDHHGVGPIRKAIDQQVPVRAVLVLANPGFDQGLPREQRKAALKIVADVGQCRRGYLTVTRFRVKAPTVPVVGDLEAATFQVRHAVVDIAPVEVRPPGQLVPQEAVVAGPRSQHVDPTPARRRLYGRRQIVAARRGTGMRRTGLGSGAPRSGPTPARASEPASR